MALIKLWALNNIQASNWGKGISKEGGALVGAGEKWEQMKEEKPKTYSVHIKKIQMSKINHS